jgi:hypothetical protein
MPYKDPDRRRQAEREWRRTHREYRAAYMRRYRRARSSGRRPGRPRTKREAGNSAPGPSVWLDELTHSGSWETTSVSGHALRPTESSDERDRDLPRPEPAGELDDLPRSPSAMMTPDSRFAFA